MKSNQSHYDSEFATAVAASAFAIHSMEETRLEYEKKLRNDFGKPMNRVKTRREDIIRPPEPFKMSMNDQRKFLSSRELDISAGRAASDHSQMSMRPRSTDSKADAWENAAIAKIRKRYEKLDNAIHAWEDQKKRKAKLKLERKQRELDLRRSLNVQHYQNKLARIEHIAGGAISQAEEKRKREELEVKERVRKARPTGRAPVANCFCF